MIIDCISDLHGHYPHLEGGDLLIVAGDLTAKDTQAEYLHFFRWIAKLNYRKKILIAGNHDNWIEQNDFPLQSIADFNYLCDSGTEFEGLKIWGSPWSLWFKGINPRCKAFTGSEKDLEKKFKLIPDNIDILVTHSPPKGIFDKISYYSSGKMENVGSLSLLMKATQLQNLKLFVFGHIHEGYNIYTPEELKAFAKQELFGPAKCKSFPYIINASYVNEQYQPVNKPIRIIL